MVNIISYTDDFYLNSAVRYLFSADKNSPTETSIKAGLKIPMLDYIILFNDKYPSQSLMRLSTYNGFKTGDIILIVSDVVPAVVVTRFIHDECRVFVQSSKAKINDWLASLKVRSENREGFISLGSRHKPLLSNKEKFFLNSLKGAQTQKDFAITAAIHIKAASAYKRSVMRKLGAQHTPQLLDYVNANCFKYILSYL